MLKGDVYDTFGYFWCYLYNIGCMKSSTIYRVVLRAPEGPYYLGVVSPRNRLSRGKTTTTTKDRC